MFWGNAKGSFPATPLKMLGCCSHVFDALKSSSTTNAGCKHVVDTWIYWLRFTPSTTLDCYPLGAGFMTLRVHEAGFAKTRVITQTYVAVTMNHSAQLSSKFLYRSVVLVRLLAGLQERCGSSVPSSLLMQAEPRTTHSKAAKEKLWSNRRGVVWFLLCMKFKGWQTLNYRPSIFQVLFWR